ncbi:D-glucuronyl C5-epimerase family protein [Sporosarcina trichiuri]|uniref:D-glucuronyl C5-epimerase family protein n=1 Tax=Sporosarcina trichiuri TaxID=3056445 RepID=UPI0025B2BE9D|nr:D-glucuronyl C5-epimerase family protein [Sporosarcina sp. 0.2-SM1T-5]WJY26416.1 D-glucuronyl C5-epimerase family protein [Sporosarcina sp. 0.2-SM1T-5]
MGLSIYNIKKWTRMLTGKSIEHVNQGVGKVYSIPEIKGYYNDLTEKVTKGVDLYDVKLPKLKIENGDEVLFPIAIFQYGLGAYDLYLLKKDKLFLDKFNLCVEWALDTQQRDGSWDNFFFKFPDAPYSSMAQGEGVSLLIRAYKEFNDEKYLVAAEKAINFLIIPLEKGGTTKYVNGDVFLLEATNKPTILNGWIFSLFGLYDYIKVVNDDKVRSIYDRSVQTLINHMGDFDNGYWSKYDLGKMIASPFYHNLHVSLLDAMYEITNESIFKDFSTKWNRYQNNLVNKNYALFKKAVQKIVEK